MITRKTLSLPDLGSAGMEIPYFEIIGKSEGPQLTLLAGVHGAEYASIAAVKEFVKDLDPDSVLGRIIAVPIVNLLGFWSRSAFVVPVDGKNLNRNFPGNINGSFTEVLAHHIFEKFILGADYLVDLHAGDIPESLAPFSIFEESAVELESRNLALAYGLGHIVRQSTVARTVAGSTCAAAADIGIPAIIAESGQNGLLDRNAIDIHLAGLRNLARTIGVLEGEPWSIRPSQIHEGWHWLRADKSGWWHPMIATGVSVKAGELLGTMSDLWGDVFVEVRAPEAGTLLFQTSSPAVSADGILIGLGRE
jgi:predicted deacylase